MKVEGKLKYILAVAILCGIGLVFCGVLWVYAPNVIKENQIFENIQVVFLLFGFSLFFYSFIRSTPGSYGILFVGLSLLYLSFGVRELELEEAQTWIAILTNPPVRNYWLAAAWAGSVILFFRNMKKTFGSFLVWIKGSQGVFLIVGGIFYLVADLFDKKMFPMRFEEHMLVEESLELYATIFMAASAVSSLVWARKQAWWGGAKRAFR